MDKKKSRAVANTSGIRGQNFSRSDKETAKRSSENENVKPSNSCTSDRGSEIVANTDSRCSDRENKEVRSRGEAINSSGKGSGIVANTKNSSGEQTEWQRGESVGGGSVDSIRAEDQRNDLERAADVVNSKDIRPTFSTHEEQRKGSSTRYSEGELERGSADVANAKIKQSNESTNDTRVSKQKQGEFRGSGCKENVVNSKRKSRETQLQWEQRVLREQNTEGQTEGPSGGDVSERGIGETFSEFCRIFNGISGWLDEPGHIQRTTHKNEYRAERLKQLGNALLPQITYRIGLAIKEIEEKK